MFALNSPASEQVTSVAVRASGQGKDSIQEVGGSVAAAFVHLQPAGQQRELLSVLCIINLDVSVASCIKCKLIATYRSLYKLSLFLRITLNA